MVRQDRAKPDLRARVDSGRILFDMMDGDTPISCAISQGALEELVQSRCGRPADQLAHFIRLRPRIEALARDKLNARPAGMTGRLNLWADDVENTPTDSGVAQFAPAATQAG